MESQVARPIYGTDSRNDVANLTDELMEKLGASIRATVALVSRSALLFDGEKWEISPAFLSRYGERRPCGGLTRMCSDTRFGDQVTPAFCSGTAVELNGQTFVLTAGHCMYLYPPASEASLDRDAAFVFDFDVTEPDSSDARLKFDRDQVFFFSDVASARFDNALDYALVRTDRPLPEDRVVSFSPSSVSLNEKVYMVGHPVGLPKKITLDGAVLSKKTNEFDTNLDAFVGNSGSAVYSSDKMDNRVHGILVRGAADFRSNGLCCQEDVLPLSGGSETVIDGISILTDVARQNPDLNIFNPPIESVVDPVKDDNGEEDEKRRIELEDKLRNFYAAKQDQGGEKQNPESSRDQECKECKKEEEDEELYIQYKREAYRRFVQYYGYK